MKLALLSDLHANLHALEACLSHAKNQGANRYAFLGDLVGYGAFPSQVTEIVMQHLEQGAMVIKGNHDEMAVNPPAVVETYGASTAAWTQCLYGLESGMYFVAMCINKPFITVVKGLAECNSPPSPQFLFQSINIALGWPL